jgi:RNA polymerase sigma-70 factor (ECF subfamily)
LQSLTVPLDQPDRVLVDLARRGDNDAFAELVRRHYSRCIELATFLLRNHSDAEDRVQLAFLKSHIHLSQYYGEAEFSTWLSRIVSNECFMFMREKRRATFMYLDDRSREQESELPLELPDRGQDPERALASRELKQVLRTEIRHIPPVMRNAFILHYIQGLPMTAVAERLQISVPAAKSRLQRARAELRLRLRPPKRQSRNSLDAVARGSSLNRGTGAVKPLMFADT